MLRKTDATSRVDDLGRVVIPRSICQELGIQEGENLDIYKDRRGVYFGKRSTRSEYLRAAKILYLNILQDGSNSVPDSAKTEVLESLAHAVSLLSGVSGKEV